MNVTLFEKKFDSTIWSRGKQYYKEGLIGNVVKLGDVIKAESYGNSTYRLKMNLKTKEMLCSCPCDFTCKHLAALVLWLKNNDPADSNTQVNTLKAKSKEELLSILQTILEKHPETTMYVQTLDERAITDLIKKLWLPRNNDNISFFNQLDYIKEAILKKKKYALTILFVRKLVDMYDHASDWYEYEDYVFEFLGTVSEQKFTTKEKVEIRTAIKDYGFEDAFE